MSDQTQTTATIDHAPDASSNDGAPGSTLSKGDNSALDHEDQNDPIVRIKALRKSFGKQVILDGIDLDLARGETTVILGPSGTGKSVLLKHMVGLIHPDSGQVVFEGEDMCCVSRKHLVEKRKRIGFLFQMGALFDSLTIGDNVAFPLVQHTKMRKGERSRAVSGVLALVGLEGVEQQMPASLSGGQRKRVALARAIVLEPSMVLYDEPTTGLDPIRSDVINELIDNLGHHTGITNIVVTHDMTSANKIADRMVLISEGGIICDGTPEQFKQSDNDLVQRFINGHADANDLAKIREAFKMASNPNNPSTPNKPTSPTPNRT